MAGRFGPYVTDGTTNASLPKTTNPDELTLEDALDLLAARAAKGPARKRVTKKAAFSAAKKTVKKATKKAVKKTTKKAAKKAVKKTSKKAAKKTA